ncbi:helix-turn-helix domain-containing protein [Burkholderia cenocepacia]|uniref:helix-turn-helix domain-containing protein n=1 Tax=Burkholderia cenocepacia TaxID=95486 RepID=UPI001AA0DBDD|nr:helix-turn-helix domain-containing protein [Burkholderia cenocepacia]MBO1856833.1 helix-turn-helix domain-containing protein [Burkholderia cenocepacia]
MQPMHPEDIKAAIRKSGANCAQIARDLNVSKTTITRVIQNNSKSTRVARRICELSGLDPQKAWPGRYPDLKISRHASLAAEAA